MKILIPLKIMTFTIFSSTKKSTASCRLYPSASFVCKQRTLLWHFLKICCVLSQRLTQVSTVSMSIQDQLYYRAYGLVSIVSSFRLTGVLQANYSDPTCIHSANYTKVKLCVSVYTKGKPSFWRMAENKYHPLSRNSITCTQWTRGS